MKITINIPAFSIDVEIPLPPARAYLTLGDNMPGQINVDTTNETALVQFVDDHGDPVNPPAGASVTFASSDDTVLTVAADAANPWQADITPVKVGSADVSATLTGANDPKGNPITVAPVTVTVNAGPAAGASLVLSI